MTHLVLLAASLMTFLTSCDADFTMTLMHTNDIHARYEQFSKFGSRCSDKMAAERKCYGGYARLKTAVDKIRADYKNTLLVDAGDQYQGTLYFYTHGGNITSYFMNLVNYDAMAVGNHEFDRKVEGLVPFVREVTFPVLSANLDASGEPSLQPLIHKSVVKTVGGQRVGIVGYTTEETPMIAPAGKVKFHSVVKSVEQEVRKLRSSGVKVIIAVGHAGFPVDLQVAKIPGVSVVIGGHTNTFLYTGKPPSNEVPAGDYPKVVIRDDGTKAVAAQCYTWAKYLCALHLTFSDQDGQVLAFSGQPQLLDSSVPQDTKTLKLLEPWSAVVKKMRKEVIGVTNVKLEGDRKVCRQSECNLGNLITDAVVAQNKDHPDQLKWADVNIALLNSGSIRSTILPGNITVGDVLSVLPFGDTIDVFRIQGRYLKKALEWSVHQLNPCETEDLPGRFLQLSGINVEYDLRQPRGMRVRSAKAKVWENGQHVYRPVEDGRDYKVIVSTYIAQGGDGYSMLSNHAVSLYPLGDVIADVVVEYIKRTSPIHQALNGRIKYVNRSNVCKPKPVDDDCM